MRLRTVYLVLCVVGAVLPYTQFVPWVLSNGLDVPLFFRQLFANRVGGFFGMDVFGSTAVLLVFSFAEGSRLGVRRRWLPAAAALTVGVSLGLPLFLYMRERKLMQDG